MSATAEPLIINATHFCAASEAPAAPGGLTTSNWAQIFLGIILLVLNVAPQVVPAVQQALRALPEPAAAPLEPPLVVAEWRDAPMARSVQTAVEPRRPDLQSDPDYRPPAFEVPCARGDSWQLRNTPG